MTQRDIKLSDLEREFLSRLDRNMRLRHADRAEDRARQRVRKAGLAKVVMNPRRWIITEAGRSLLNGGDKG